MSRKRFYRQQCFILCRIFFACLLAVVPRNASPFVVPLLAPTPSLTSFFFLCFLQIELEAILGLNQDLLPPLDENGQIIPNKLSKVRAEK